MHPWAKEGAPENATHQVHQQQLSEGSFVIVCCQKSLQGWWV